ncbi:hypothetical protein FJ872_01760 [Mesorhizobium sp. B2-5-9]|uniref:Uncharacterized protein n=2 Tax=Mesorhizobium TaxID=68287 RepID=L0KSR8_MESAW|nr:hypothetical protein Mesci_5886 [Mesorhizobium ciceri biovar biserrulae WSM1271]AGB48161.1 hypothetical protein Mesau_05932 [Mesorhizobium australicum WSM2073]ARP67368.1 hypothetical protein A9K65_031720 [Mesorhizobium sp. WSM1497]PBC13186.1 hypothetical protein CK225_28150 [Mesorhizobium loti]TPI86333.1 hypothetical protein FJ423_00440 [Mesorhizobium sp. B2-8-9]TPJ29767.1 hypothetical protein FJ425_07980 [Mesorhizobium sp. B2-7-2]TPJ41858.1 hypothetical protein FJ432_12070 [Mesorhizobium 
MGLILVRASDIFAPRGHLNLAATSNGEPKRPL